MTTTQSQNSDVAADTRAVRSLDGFRSLNPANGLFLQAEHLATMQSYARSLTFATAQATGTGVVHGLTVALGKDRTSLEISPGLAISPAGELLRMEHTLRLPLDDEHLPALPSHGFWVVEARWASGTSGSSPVYGSLCNDACTDGGGTIQPWRDEGLAVQLRSDTMTGLDGERSDVRRNWLASHYFERERAAVPPWLVPARGGARVAPLPTNAWGDGTALPTNAGVPLAVLQRVDGDWVLDMWTARRLVDGASAHAAWRGRLAMRPWSVFLAQLLQFEEALAAGSSALGSATADPDKLVVLDVDVEEALRGPVTDFLRNTEGKPFASWHIVEELRDAFDRAVPRRGKVTAARSLKGLGMVELPPAGYLSVEETREDLKGLLEDFFGPQVRLRLCSVRADHVAAAVSDAQHRDRIPLAHDRAPYPQVDVLVPDQPADKAELYVEAYGWVAFVRRPLVCDDLVVPIPEQKTEDVTVYTAFRGDTPTPEAEFRDGQLKDVEPIGTLTYPVGGWDYPGTESATQAALKAAEIAGLSGPPMTVVALTADTDHRPIAALRASLFTASVDTGIGARPVHAFPNTSGAEAIVLVFQIQIS
ncbi:hypothetical protein EV649_5085 [Kribbella sp. VKM Ac-2569]|uniref:hypothetical protein n=1 Tax=Kribbella sp. VKM Ac-2569 TaxID=2512220 RepID=UPI00102CE5B0|nr:hypothetical protein [Kribbella sp. VKM Ac-2569]RZT17538.1 hypothetical protein EV649_5085 [Kribbella sp. VKM Ac-2569]